MYIFIPALVFEPSYVHTIFNHVDKSPPAKVLYLLPNLSDVVLNSSNNNTPPEVNLILYSFVLLTIIPLNVEPNESKYTQVDRLKAWSVTPSPKLKSSASGT